MNCMQAEMMQRVVEVRLKEIHMTKLQAVPKNIVCTYTYTHTQLGHTVFSRHL
jgi:hypothetical protein